MDPITELVSAISAAMLPAGEVVAVEEMTTGQVLVVNVMVRSRAASGWLIGRDGSGIAMVRDVAERVLKARERWGLAGRYAGVTVHVENEEAPVGRRDPGWGNRRSQ